MALIFPAEFMGETSKARARREREGWFEKYAPANKPGIDIACGHDPLNDSFQRWDKEFGDGDATILAGVPPNTFYTVYASHVLEHLTNARQAIARWYEVLQPGGHLIILVPHRDLYEQRTELPSFNPDHLSFWLPDQEEPPDTKSLKKEVLETIPEAQIVILRILDEQFIPGMCHPYNEYSIEMIVRKP